MVKTTKISYIFSYRRFFSYSRYLRSIRLTGFTWEMSNFCCSFHISNIYYFLRCTKWNRNELFNDQLIIVTGNFQLPIGHLLTWKRTIALKNPELNQIIVCIFSDLLFWLITVAACKNKWRSNYKSKGSIVCILSDLVLFSISV